MSGGHNRGRGSRGGPRGAPGRGKSPYRGRGRGRGRGGGGGRGGYYTLNEMDEVYMMADTSPDYQFTSGTASPHGRGRGSNPNSGSNTPRGRGSFNYSTRGRGGFNDYGSPRGRGRGEIGGHFPRGRGGIGDSPRGYGAVRGRSKLRQDAPLSALLAQERPLLRPIIFVPSVFSKTLFQEEEEIIQAVVEDVDEEEESHVPTADRVFRVFSGGNIPRMSSASEDDGDEDSLEEIDFNDMAKLLETPVRPMKTEVDVVEERFLGIRLSKVPGHEVPADNMDVDAIASPSLPEQTALTTPEILLPKSESNKDASILVDDSQSPESLHQAAVQLPRPDESTITTNASILASSQGAVPNTGFCIDIDPTSISSSDPVIVSLSIPVTEALAEHAVATQVPSSNHPAVGVSFAGNNVAGDASEIPPSPDMLILPSIPKMSDMVIDAQASEATVAGLGLSDAPEASLDERKIVVDVGPTFTKPPAAVSSSDPPRAFEVFYIDTQPSQVDLPHQGKPSILQDDEEEVIVYVAPHPGRISPPPTSISTSTSTVAFLPSTSILTGTTTLSSTNTSSPPKRTSSASALPRSQAPTPAFESISFSFSPTPKKGRVYSKHSKAKAQIKQRRQEVHAARRRLEQQMLFGSFGAMMQEAQLRGESIRDLDPRWDERRRGDSDVDWGDDGDDDAEDTGEGPSGLAEGMELDPELEGDAEALTSFVKSMSVEGSRFVTMDDIADGEIMRLEDEGEDENLGSSGDDDEDEDEDEDDAIDTILHAEEQMLIMEPRDGDLEEDDESDDEDDSDDNGDSPRTSFQARLERLRRQSKINGKKLQMRTDNEDDDDDDDDYFRRADEDEDFIEEIQMMLEENDYILMGRDRKARNQLFRAVRNGAFEDLDDFKPARKAKDKYKDLPPELQDQWQKDRDKKAENKRLRALKRLELAADPISFNKGGKKGRKAMLSAAKLDPTITVLPNRVIDMTTLVQQIRRFIGNVGGPESMSLPPTTKETRKKIHEMALAFNLKSVSKGKGDARYTTLTKTTRTGLHVDKKKVAKIVRWQGGGGDFMGSNSRGSRAGNIVVPRHREGEEVGKAAPKIGESNIGFKMLALMGWSEGQRIGMTGGLDAPLTAVIKNTKLGLGATR